MSYKLKDIPCHKYDLEKLSKSFNYLFMRALVDNISQKNEESLASEAVCRSTMEIYIDQLAYRMADVLAEELKTFGFNCVS